MLRSHLASSAINRNIGTLTAVQPWGIVAVLAALLILVGCQGLNAKGKSTSTLPPSQNTVGSLGASTLSLDFGGVLVASSKGLSLTATNNGSSDITVSSVTFSAPQFTLNKPPVPVIIAAGQSSTFRVLFDPTVARSITGSMTMTSNASNSSMTIALQGAGLASRPLTASPPSINYLNVVVGNSRSASETLTNSSGSSVTIIKAVLLGAGFSLNGLKLPVTLVAGQSTAFSLVLTPQAAGSADGNLAILSDASNPTLNIPLSGSAVWPGTLTPALPGINFGDVQTGHKQSVLETVTNSGGSDVMLSQAKATGIGFSIDGITQPLTLTSGQSVTFNVVFTPLSAGSESGNVAITSDASNATLNILLSGTGVTAPPSGQLAVSPASLNLGNVVMGNNSAQSALLQASGASVTVTSASFSNPAFTLSGISFPVTIQAGNSTSFMVTFAPQAAGQANATLSFISNASISPTLQSLTGNGTLSSVVPATFFGMHQSHTAACNTGDLAYPLFDVGAGAFRIWSTCKTQWGDMNPTSGVFEFTGLDELLAALKTNGNNDVYISLGETPHWISSDPADTLCDQANVFGEPTGMCDPPSDLNKDGTGTDQAWRDFAAALVSHVSGADYLETHARITNYEIWSEFHRSDTVGVPGTTCHTPQSNDGSPCSFRGTFAQMLRMTQDMRCIVEGRASDPITGLGLTCGTANYAQIGIDPTAQVMEGDAGGGSLDDGTVTLENYLYCDAKPPAGSECTWSRANPLGANATDVISGHSYFNHGAIPEQVMQYISEEKAMLSTADAVKPYFTGEGSWGKNETVNDPALQAAYVPRWYMALLISGVQRGYWFAWDEFQATGTGGLWSPTLISFPPVSCMTPDPVGGYYCTGGTAYIQTVIWLGGATVTTFTCSGNCSDPSPGIFTFNITRSGGYQAQIAWDSTSPSLTCSNPMCGSTPLPPPPFTVVQWRDVAGNTHTGAPSNIGASPIIMENMAPPS